MPDEDAPPITIKQDVSRYGAQIRPVRRRDSELTPTINAYASYTGILKTNNVLGNRPAYGEGGGWLPPITAIQKKSASKGGLWNDKLNFALSYFTMTSRKITTLEPTGSRCCEWKYGGKTATNRGASKAIGNTVR